MSGFGHKNIKGVFLYIYDMSILLVFNHERRML